MLFRLKIHRYVPSLIVLLSPCVSISAQMGRLSHARNSTDQGRRTEPPGDGPENARRQARSFRYLGDGSSERHTSVIRYREDCTRWPIQEDHHRGALGKCQAVLLSGDSSPSTGTKSEASIISRRVFRIVTAGFHQPDRGFRSAPAIRRD